MAKFMSIVGGWELVLTDGNDHILTSQRIEFSDFPLDEITLYVVPEEMEIGRPLRVILLTSEY